MWQPTAAGQGAVNMQQGGVPVPVQHQQHQGVPVQNMNAMQGGYMPQHQGYMYLNPAAAAAAQNRMYPPHMAQQGYVVNHIKQSFICNGHYITLVPHSWFDISLSPFH
jgi:hypothetical protein